MDQLNRIELMFLIEGLDSVRDRMRKYADGVTIADDIEEYNLVVRLQDRLIDALESRFY